MTGSGPHTFEVSSRNTSPAGSPSNALDTFYRLYVNAFNPAAPGAGVASNDDFTGALTVLPGPFTVNGVTSTATGFTGAQPSSRMATISLTAGLRYFLVTTSFRSTDYVVTTGGEGGPTGPYWAGINPGDVVPTAPTPTPTPIVATPTPTATPSASPTCVPLLVNEGFEAGALGVFTSSGTGSTWANSTAQFHTGTRSAFATDPATNTDQRLTLTAPITLPAGATLSFWHTFAFDSPLYDGGVLEVSTNGGTTFVDVGPANFLSGGYNGTLNGLENNPLGARPAWVNGTIGAMTQVQVNLSSFAGPNFTFRFREGTGDTTAGTGWFIDDVQITRSCGGASPTPTASPTASPTATIAGTATPSPTCTATSVRVVPNEYTSTAAPGGNGLNTFIRDTGNPRTGQLLINANQLTGLVGQSITSITGRLFAGATVPYPATAATWTDYTISMGQGVAFGSQTTTFASNFVGAPTVVRSGPLTIPAAAFTAGGNPNAFGSNIPLTTPFVYTGGNLLIEVRHTGSNIVNNAANDFLEAAALTDPNYNINFWSATATGNTATTGAVNTFTVVRLNTAGGGCGTPIPTKPDRDSGNTNPDPTASPSATCAPGVWTAVAPFPVPDVYGAAATSNGTSAWLAGGYSFSASSDVNNFRRYDLGSNTWTTLAPMPDIISNASAVYSPINNKVYVFGGGNATTGVVSNATRIYDVAAGTWSAGTNMPDVRGFMAKGYFNGKIYLVGGYSTGNISPAFGQVWEYDPIANTFNTTRLDMPATLGGAGSGVINGHLYVAGGRDATNTVVGSLFDYDIAANTWTTRASLPSAINVPGGGVLNGQLWIYGGGTPFLGAPDTTSASSVYDPGTNTWAAGPSLTEARSFVAGTNIGNTLFAAGGYNGSTTVTTTETLTGGGGCPSPTPGTPTLTPSVSPCGTAG